MAAQTSPKARRKRLARNLLLALAIIVFLFPILWTLLASFGITPDDTSSPPDWTWPPTVGNYLQIGVAEPGFLNELVTSLSVAVTATTITMAIAFLAAYGLARSRSRRPGARVQIFLILANLPVMAYLIPLTATVRRLGLYDSFFGVALVNAAIFAPLAVYILFGYLRQTPVDLEESAHLDGATVWQILWQVIRPQVAAGLAATAIILFVLNWNLLLVPLALTESHVKTIPVAMSDFFTFERDLQWPVAAAVLISSLLPLLLLVTLAYRYIERFHLQSLRDI